MVFINFRSEEQLDWSRHCQAKKFGRLFEALFLILDPEILGSLDPDLGSDLRVMRGFQNGSTLGGSISRSDDIEVLHKGVAKKFAKNLHLS